MPVAPAGDGPTGAGVRVMVRVRPLNAAERKKGVECCVEASGDRIVLLDADLDFAEKAQFQFDRVFWSVPQSQLSSDAPFASQEDVYDEAGRPVLDEALEGYNTCLLAYGQTGSGKTYTMLGTPKPPEERGVIPRLCGELFSRVEKLEAEAAVRYTLELSFMELYQERVKDLLVIPDKGPKVFKDRWQKEADGAPQELRVRQHPLSGPFVDGLIKATVKTAEESLGLIARGGRERTTGETLMNAESSRSHAVLQLTITRTEALGEVTKGRKKAVNNVRISRVNLVDLAGSERVQKTQAQGQRLAEAAAINKSLTTLRMVIDTLIDNAKAKAGKVKVPPYRESLLTWILADCFGGNACLRMIATVGPHPWNSEETTSTLRYAQRARGIVNRARVNEDGSAKLIRDLNEKVKRLEEQLENGRRRGTVNPQQIAHLEAEAALQRKAREELHRHNAEVQEALQRQRDEAARLQREREELVSRGEDLQRERAMWKDRAQRAEAALTTNSSGHASSRGSTVGPGWGQHAAALVSALKSFLGAPQRPGHDAVYAHAEGLLAGLCDSLSSAEDAPAPDQPQEGSPASPSGASGSSDDDRPPPPPGAEADAAAFGSCLVNSAAFFPGAQEPGDALGGGGGLPGMDEGLAKSSLVLEGEQERQPQREYVSNLRQKLVKLQDDGRAVGAGLAPTPPAAPPPAAAAGEGAGEQQSAADDRVACKSCGRRFAPAVVERHEKTCTKTQPKRKPFDTAAQRKVPLDAGR
eukprot:TRINITY_DN2428_c0_g1_i1.p2 TRINITY_DN2428_c0_g1~~TRINITY_DN2428_c0_g1_i1.p2  ORF type:complete len:754 (+),score=263.10 TRINITY_DN2428_c0_g1_i1:112-2373(+)